MNENTKKESWQDAINHLANVIPNGQLLSSTMPAELLHEAAKIIEGREENRIKVRLYKTRMLDPGSGQWIDLPLLWGNREKAQDNAKELRANNPDTQIVVVEMIAIIESEIIIDI